MFGVGIFEVLVILIVAVIALGPNKLPQAIIDVVKFFRAVKKTMAEAKDTFDKEIQLSEIKQEALKYKDTITTEVNKLTKDMQLDELRQISVDTITKPLEEGQKKLQEQTQALQSSLDALNTEVTYDSPNTSNPSQTPHQNPISTIESNQSQPKPHTPSEGDNTNAPHRVAHSVDSSTTLDSADSSASASLQKDH